MEVNVAQLLKEPIGAERHYHLELEGEDAHYLDEVLRAEGNIHLLRLARSIMVTGKVEALVKMACVRCLDNFRQVVTFDLQDEYFPLIDMSTGAHLPPPTDPGVFTISPDHVLSLEEALREYTILALPMKAVCRADCRGLCPQCGANLNQGACQCAGQPVDNRLAPLAELKKKLI